MKNTSDGPERRQRNGNGARVCNEKPGKFPLAHCGRRAVVSARSHKPKPRQSLIREQRPMRASLHRQARANGSDRCRKHGMAWHQKAGVAPRPSPFPGHCGQNGRTRRELTFIPTPSGPRLADLGDRRHPNRATRTGYGVSSHRPSSVLTVRGPTASVANLGWGGADKNGTRPRAPRRRFAPIWARSVRDFGKPIRSGRGP